MWVNGPGLPYSGLSRIALANSRRRPHYRGRDLEDAERRMSEPKNSILCITRDIICDQVSNLIIAKIGCGISSIEAAFTNSKEKIRSLNT